MRELQICATSSLPAYLLQYRHSHERVFMSSYLLQGDDATPGLQEPHLRLVLFQITIAIAIASVIIRVVNSGRDEYLHNDREQPTGMSLLE